MATLCCPLGCVPVDFWRFSDADRRYEATADEAPPDEFDEFGGMLFVWGFLNNKQPNKIALGNSKVTFYIVRIFREVKYNA